MISCQAAWNSPIPTVALAIITPRTISPLLLFYGPVKAVATINMSLSVRHGRSPLLMNIGVFIALCVLPFTLEVGPRVRVFRWLLIRRGKQMQGSAGLSSRNRRGNCRRHRVTFPLLMLRRTDWMDFEHHRTTTSKRCPDREIGG